MSDFKLTLPEPTFRPMKAPNELLTFNELEALPKDQYFISEKLDGIRMVVHAGKITSNSAKEVPNKFLYKYFEQIIEVSKKYPSLYFDGEFHSDKLTFQEIYSYWSTHWKEFKAISMTEWVPKLEYKMFDVWDSENPTMPFELRIKKLNEIFMEEKLLMSNISLVRQGLLMNSISAQFPTIESLLEFTVSVGKEGFMLKHKNSKYKQGRATLKENTIHKVKKYETFDGKVIDVTQATVVDADADTKVNELGYAETSRKKEDRIYIESAAALIVIYKNAHLKVSLASLTHQERKNIWANRHVIIGENTWIEYKAMMIGAKDVPRHPMFVRFREEKEDE